MTKHGVPFDTAWAMVEGGMDVEAAAYIIAFGEIEGGTFNVDRMEWKKDS